MDAISTIALVKSLDALAMRQVTTANNVANAGSPGFVPSRVTFEDALASATRAAARGDAGAVDRLVMLRPRVGPDAKVLVGDSMRVDLEMASAAETSMRYGALIGVLDRQLQLNSLAVTGGGR